MAFQRPHPEVLKKHIRFLRQLADQSLAAAGRDVDSYGALVSVRRQVVRRFAAQPRRSPLTGIVAMPRSFNLDDVGAVVPEQLTSPGTSQHPAHVEYADILQCGSHGTHRVPKSSA